MFLDSEGIRPSNHSLSHECNKNTEPPATHSSKQGNGCLLKAVHARYALTDFIDDERGNFHLLPALREIEYRLSEFHGFV